VFSLFLLMAGANAAEVSGTVALNGKSAKKDASGVIVYLIPAGGEQIRPVARRGAEGPYRLVQKNKMFSPHLLIVPVGAEVEFPNEDRVFHNVFSVYENAKFDLGLYEVGSMKKVRFTHPGPSFIFCNIHPQMSAIVFALDTPFHAVSNAAGEFQIADVPNGQYQLRVWSERGSQEQLNQIQRTIQVKSDTQVPLITIEAAPSITQGHKNKFGKDYDVSTPTDYP
jgi:plastocyanin